jgi:hypothetical protein
LQAALFETHVGYTSPRQLRAHLRTLFKRDKEPQTARHAVIVQIFPDGTILQLKGYERVVFLNFCLLRSVDWSAAAVQWRRDGAVDHPEGFQLVAALDFGIGALSAAAKALYALEQPAETHMPAVPQDRWVRHAVVADNRPLTACHTRHPAYDGGEWECEGLWYINDDSAGRPVLFFPKADVLHGLDIPAVDKEGAYELDLGDVFGEVFHAL